MERLTKRWLVTQFAKSVGKILALLEIGENKNELALPNTSTNTLDAQANQRIRATTTRTTARGSVMKQALKALMHEMEYVLSCINADKVPFDGDDFHEALRLGKEALAQPEKPQPDRITTLRQFTENHSVDCLCSDCAALDDLDEALAQPERHELQKDGKHPAPCARFCEANAFQIEIRRLKAQLAQPKEPEQEPVAYVGRTQFERLKDCGLVTTSLTTHKAFESDVTLYTTPPQRTWVGLTDEEIEACFHHVDEAGIGLFDFAEAIEAKLKEKNA